MVSHHVIPKRFAYESATASVPRATLRAIDRSTPTRQYRLNSFVGKRLIPTREVAMGPLGTTAVFGRVKPLEQASFTPQMEDSQNAAREFPPAYLGFSRLAHSFTQLLETALREFERDSDVAKAALVTASSLLQAEVKRYSNANGSARDGLAPWQILRVRGFIDSNLHRTIHIRDLSAVAQRSPAHFARKFKLAVGEPPHAYVVRKRLERACHLMVTSAVSLTEIAFSVGFSDQAHLCRHFRAAFGQSPAKWRREHGNLGRHNPDTNENIT